MWMPLIIGFLVGAFLLKTGLIAPVLGVGAVLIVALWLLGWLSRVIGEVREGLKAFRR